MSNGTGWKDFAVASLAKTLKLQQMNKKIEGGGGVSEKMKKNILTTSYFCSMPCRQNISYRHPLGHRITLPNLQGLYHEVVQTPFHPLERWGWPKLSNPAVTSNRKCKHPVRVIYEADVTAWTHSRAFPDEDLRILVVVRTSMGSFLSCSWRDKKWFKLDRRVY